LRPRDTVSAVAKLTVKPQDARVRLAADFETSFAEEFKARFTPPTRVSLSAVVGSANCDSVTPRCRTGELWLSSTALVMAGDDGSFSRIGLADESVTPAIAELLRTTLETMSKERAVPRSGRKSLPLLLSIRLEANPDTIAPERKLFQVRVPRYDLAFTGAAALPNAPAPRYPPNAEVARLGDSVVVSFVVMPNGSPNPGSVAIVAGRYTDFIASVLNSIARAVYKPAHLGGCPVASWTKQTFMFVAP
jgi:hypothetical protein